MAMCSFLLRLIIFLASTALVFEHFIDNQSRLTQRQCMRILVLAEFQGRCRFEIGLWNDALAMRGSGELDAGAHFAGLFIFLPCLSCGINCVVLIGDGKASFLGMARCDRRG